MVLPFPALGQVQLNQLQENGGRFLSLSVVLKKSCFPFFAKNNLFEEAHTNHKNEIG